MIWINRLYILFLGIILSITTGFGIAAFYPEPQRPSYPISKAIDTTPASCYSTPENQKSPECQEALKNQQNLNKEQIQLQQQYEIDMKNYQNVEARYTRTAIFFGFFFGALFAVIGIACIKKSKLIATGFLLSSVLTAIFTKVLIGLASLGSEVTGTSQTDVLSFIEFGALLLLSLSVIFVGYKNLRDNA